jgi:hypothetical protein
MEVVQHGVSMLLRNLGPALRVSLGPVLIALAITAILAALGLGSFGALMATGGEMTEEEALAAVSQFGWGTVFGSIIAAVVWLFALSWVAVAWHRHVLLEEKTGLLPPLRQDLVWPYLGRTILLSLILVLLSIPVAFGLGLLLAISDSFVMLFIVGVLTWLALGWVAMRLSLALPARAVDRPMGFGESWNATAPASGGILVIVLVLGVINVILGWLIPAIFGVGVVAAILSLVVQWFTAMLGLSVLTTLYGHLVERRTLAV